ncbi:hypothetical protein FA13DRAFT_1091451 [Coprinellus micaceus]|uniref:Uncharacterized protein n=1 Tax=Coprinellus micaceus TaxID=71717 RepID=A0A4Y7TS04_COPMI|nr:hypothetical protein FA13DRAFT_1091451 [Coprinellus micaceus]
MMHGQERDLGWCVCTLDRPSGARAVVAAPYPYDLSHSEWYYPEFRLCPLPPSLRLPPSRPSSIAASNIQFISSVPFGIIIDDYFTSRTLLSSNLVSSDLSKPSFSFLDSGEIPPHRRFSIVIPANRRYASTSTYLSLGRRSRSPRLALLPRFLGTSFRATYRCAFFLPCPLLPFLSRFLSTCFISEYERFSHTCFECAPCYAFISSVTPYTLTLPPQPHPIPGRYPRSFPRLSAFHDPCVRYLRTSFLTP